MRSARQIVIIGAPRSGTNMLRNLLCSVEGVATWPCDEINYIWRHGNIRYPTDAFTADMAKPWIRDHVRRAFEWVRRHYNAHTVVEKTCANSLRVAFVNRILDDPRYIFIHRDGVDAAGSAMNRWKAKLDLPYVIRKARFVPVVDIPYYASRYLGNHFSRVWSSEGRLPTWGPVLPDMSRLKSQHDLAEICALQWKACVESSLDAFGEIASNRVLRVAYEELVNHKEQQIPRIAEFLALDPERLCKSSYIREIKASSVGKGYSQVSPDMSSRIFALIGPTMERLGYL